MLSSPVDGQTPPQPSCLHPTHTHYRGSCPKREICTLSPGGAPRPRLAAGLLQVCGSGHLHSGLHTSAGPCAPSCLQTVSKAGSDGPPFPGPQLLAGPQVLLCLSVLTARSCLGSPSVCTDSELHSGPGWGRPGPGDGFMMPRQTAGRWGERDMASSHGSSTFPLSSPSCHLLLSPTELVSLLCHCHRVPRCEHRRPCTETSVADTRHATLCSLWVGV